MQDRSDSPTAQVASVTADAVAVTGRQCTARSPRGAVAAAAPQAALAGAMALARGGNAYDAVTAAALVEVVLLPPKCGLAGDLVALAWPASRDRPEALLAVGPAAAGLAEVARRGDLHETGPLAVGVPGAPGGYLALAERARLDLADLAEPAIALANEGFCWPSICAALGSESAELVAALNPDGCRYLPEGVPLVAGEVVTLPGLAAALERFVDEREQFLRGGVGRAIVERVGKAGGVVTMADLEQPEAVWVEPDTVGIGDAQLFATPAPTHGPYLLDAVSSANEQPSIGLHAAVMEAISLRRHSLADPAGTSMVSATDRDGTLAVAVHSNSYPRFGSGLVVDEFDLVLSNRAGRGFSSEASHPNFPAPGRRPATTLHAWGLGRDGDGRLLGATPGGANQLPWNAQSLHRLLGGATRADAVLAPRWEWLPADDGVRVEVGLDDTSRNELARSARSIEEVGLWQLRSAMQIVSYHDGIAEAVVDPRTQGAVVGL